ncbi:MAG: TolC family protein, partial [Deltaproteobacteria bacterium]|nr:TolC family protein [Deltaproteobacteria bacterium]
MTSRGRALLALTLAACYARPAPQPITPAMVAAWTRAAPAGDARPPPDWRFTADAAVAFALHHAPSLADRRDDEAIAAARIDAARQLTNPALHVGQSFDDALGGDRTVIAIRVAPDAPWTRSARIAEARAGYEVARVESVGAARALTARIHEAYARLAFGEATVALIDRARHALDERRRVLAAQVAGNVATRLEAVLAEQDAAELRAEASAIAVELDRTRAELAALIGIPPGQAWTATWD